LQTNPRQIFADNSFDPRPPAPRPHLGDSARETSRRFLEGQSVEQIALDRGLVAGTVLGHLAEAAEAGERLDLRRFVTADEQEEIEAAFARTGFGKLSAAREALGNRYEYGVLRIVRAAINAGRRQSG
jgi:ATP-dependent DNA helicase RecQ